MFLPNLASENKSPPHPLILICLSLPGIALVEPPRYEYIPISCAQAKDLGRRMGEVIMLNPSPNVYAPALCTIDAMGRAVASMFVWDGNTTADSRACTHNNPNNNMDTTALFTDFSTLIAQDQSQGTMLQNVWRITTRTGEELKDKKIPEFPVWNTQNVMMAPFPMARRTMYFDRTNSYLVFQSGSTLLGGPLSNFFSTSFVSSLVVRYLRRGE